MTLTPLKTHSPSPSSSLCASPTTSTEDSSPQLSPTSTTNKLPTLHYAISSHSHRELTLPSTLHQYNTPSSFSFSPSCETPHYLSHPPSSFPLQSPVDKEKEKERLKEEKEFFSTKKGTRRGTLNAEAKNVLKQWMFSPQHFAHPYPNEEEKEELALKAGIQVKQLSNWFTNARKRLWQPVLKQSGVEVKNFLSTGRGGPRGNKLDVVHLIQEKEDKREDNEYITECLIPMKRKKQDEKEKDEEKKKNHKRQKKEQEKEKECSFEELEILAAASLLNLYQETSCVY